MTRDSQAKITDAAQLRALVVGVGIGCIAIFSRPLIESRFLEIAPTRLQLLVVLSMAFLAGIAAALSKPSQLRSKRLAVGIGARMGVRAGFFCAIAAGGLLALQATLNTGGADTAAAENVLRHRMWFVFWVNWTAILPAVLCGFLGGMTGSGLVAAHLPDRDADLQARHIPGIRWINLVLSLAATIGLASPLSFLGRPLKVDPPPVVKVLEPRPQPTPFEYLPPEGIKTAKFGQIQTDFTKVIEQVQDDAAVSLSPDGNLFAYGDRSAPQSTISIFDLPTFKRVATIAVPALPRQCLAWSHDQKALACTIGDGGNRRIWILNLDSNRAVELPRPPGRDTPTGDVFWWQEQELAFFPNDEPPLAFDLVSLMLKPVETSSYFAKFDAETKRLWLDGPRLALPSQVGWKLDVCTVIRGAEPPPRRHPDDAWRLGGESI